MATLIIRPRQAPLTGVTTVPGDKSISHRAVMLGALAHGTSAVRKWLPAGDTIATLDAFRALGIEIEAQKDSELAWDLTIHGRGLTGLQRPAETLDCRNAGTCLRLMSGIMSGQSFPAVLDGSEQLRKRPMGRIVNPLRQMGAAIEANDERAPLRFRPSRLSGIDYRLPVASAQVKSAILLAALYAAGPTRVMEPGPTRDHTERLLGAMGVEIGRDGPWLTMQGAGEGVLQPLDLVVPGDMSSAAFLLVAAAVTPHSQITIRDVGQNQTRTGLQDILKDMGARFAVDNQRLSGGEPLADLTVHFDELHASAISGDSVVRAIDEFPIWAVAATQAAGESQLSEAAELRVKEVDRISLVAAELRKMGARIDEQPDGMIVSGPTRLNGAQVNSHGDHRLGMALAIAGLIASGVTSVEGAECIADSFPGFVQVMQSLGATIDWSADGD
jgi:3-phosphoshikimate 1-carboxyvinyltransferase